MRRESKLQPALKQSGRRERLLISALVQSEEGTAPFTPLIGRERERQELAGLLLRPQVRLVTLTGAAGIGKTRLARQIVEDMQDAFPDGVRFVSLAPLSAAHLVVPAMLQALGVSPAEHGDFVEQFKTFLQQRCVLLALDNFEQVLAAAPALVEILAACSGLKLLVSSRAVLRVQGEYEFAVAPLALPDLKHLPDEKQLEQYAAIALFLARAQQVKRDFTITSANATIIAEICSRLDGLPLALELAAARIKLLSPDALLDRLKRRLDVLTGGGPDLPARHQTLRAALAWSYDLLPAEEQRLFRHLGVFVGGFSLEEVEALGLAVGDMPSSLLDGVTALLDKSLLQKIAPPDQEPRFILLETLREYALEQLTSAGELEQARDAHAAYYLALAEEEKPSLLVLPFDKRLRRFQQMYLNLRGALDWLLERQEIEAALRLAIALTGVWALRGYSSEGLPLLERILAAAQEAQATPSLYAQALTARGHLELWHGEVRYGAAPIEEALHLFEQAEDRHGSAAALICLGMMEEPHGSFQLAYARKEEGLRRFRLAGKKIELAFVLLYLGMSALYDGQLDRLKAWCEESLQLYQALDIQWGIAASLHYLGWAAACQGDHERARTLEEESIAHFRAIGSPSPVMEALVVLAGELALAGNDQRATALLEESLASGKASGNPVPVSRALWGLGQLARQKGELARARDLYKQGLTLLLEKPRPPRIRWATAACLEGLGCIALSEAQPHRAITFLSAANVLRAGDGFTNPVGMEQPLYHQVLDTAREQLGEERFAMLWARGQMITPAEALAAEGDASAALPPAGVASTVPEAPDVGVYPDGLTAREVDVLRLLAAGLTNKQIAQRLVMSPHTVNIHVQSIYSKVDVHTRSAATHYAMTHGLM